MGKAEPLIKRRYSINVRYTIIEDVLKIDGSNFPNGVKASFLLLDTHIAKPRLLIDNTDSPHEFHMHAELPENKYAKVYLGTSNYMEALEIFYNEVKRIINED